MSLTGRVWARVKAFFDRALTEASGMDTNANLMDSLAGNRGGDPLDEWAADDDDAMDVEGAAAEEVEEAWDLAASEIPAGSLDAEPGESEDVGAEAEDGPDGEVKEGVQESELWLRNSPLAADHVAAGSFETAMQLLNRQVGAVDFSPLKALFLSTYLASRAYLPASACLPPLEVYLRRDPEEVNPRNLLPAVAHSLQSISRNELKAAYTHFRKAEFNEASAKFRAILQSLLLVITQDEAEQNELSELIITCREYLIGLSLEIERRRIANEEPDNQKRQLELAAYFTHCRLQSVHLVLALRLAMTTFSKSKNFVTAATFAKRLLELNPASNVANQAKQVLSAGDRTPRDAVEIDYDQFSSFDICAGSLTPIYRQQEGSGNQPSGFVEDPFTGARYKPEFKGTVCKVSGITEVGKKASGLRSRI